VIVGLVVAIAFASQAPAPDATLPTRAAPVPPCEKAGITPESGKAGTCMANDTKLTVAIGEQPLVLDDRKVTVLSTQFVEATSPEGQAAGRARLEVRVLFENTSRRPLDPNADGNGLYLGVAGQKVQTDPNADVLPSTLRRSRMIAAGQSTEGILRYELFGATTEAIRSAQRADLGVAGASEKRKGVIRIPLPSTAS
jgi:hypothetical protein